MRTKQNGTLLCSGTSSWVRTQTWSNAPTPSRWRNRVPPCSRPGREEENRNLGKEEEPCPGTPIASSPTLAARAPAFGGACPLDCLLHAPHFLCHSHDCVERTSSGTMRHFRTGQMRLGRWENSIVSGCGEKCPAFPRYRPFLIASSGALSRRLGPHSSGRCTAVQLSHGWPAQTAPYQSRQARPTPVLPHSPPSSALPIFSLASSREHACASIGVGGNTGWLCCC